MAEESWSVGEDSGSCSFRSGDESQPLYGWNLSPKCPKRVELDESSYHKNEYPPTVPTDNPLRDSVNLTALIRRASKHAPLQDKRRRRVPNRKRPPALNGHPSIAHHLEALRHIQKDLYDVRRDLNGAIFIEELIQLDRLQPSLARRASVIDGQFELPEPSNKGSTCTPSSEGLEVWNGFWLKVLENCLPTSLLICPWDRPALHHLLDIQCAVHRDIPAFTLTFIFGQNAHFSNRSLTRRFDFHRMGKAEYVGGLRGSLQSYVPSCCSSCQVDWFPDKNVTLTYKSSAINTTYSTEAVPRRSFFNYFSPLTTNPEWPTALPIKRKCRKALMKLFQQDFSIANMLRTKVIPHAMEFYEGVSSSTSQLVGDPTALHPVRKALCRDRGRMWTEAEMTRMEEKFIKLDLGTDHGEDKKAEVELDKDVRRALHSVGYKVRNRRAYHKEEVTTSGESSSDTEGRDGEEARQKTYRGLLETNTVKTDRRHVGIKLGKIKQTAERAASDDDLVKYKEMGSMTEGSSSPEDDVSGMAVHLNARKGTHFRKKGGKMACGQKKKRTLRKTAGTCL